jgi:hypothetical protein
MTTRSRSSRSTPRIFVSHSHKDHEFGSKLVHDLRYRLGDEDAVWYDKLGGLHGGDLWWKKIQRELQASNVFIVLLSPAAKRSKWVKEEIDIALTYRITKGMLIIPVICNPCSVPDNLKRIHTVFYQPINDYNTVLQELFTTLEENFNIDSSKLRTLLDELDVTHIQSMTQSVKDAFELEDWHYVIAVAKALINRYPKEALSVSIYEMQGLAYLYADQIYDDQEMLAQHALKTALALVNDPEQHLTLLDAYIGSCISRDQWVDVMHYANEALLLDPQNYTWRVAKDIAYEKIDQKENDLVTRNHRTKHNTTDTSKQANTDIFENNTLNQKVLPHVANNSPNEFAPFKLSVSWHSWRNFHISMQHKSSELHLHRKQNLQ